MAARPWMLAELTYHELRSWRPEVAVLPFAATEPHNFHLPYATDTLEADHLADRACAEAYRRGAKVLCLPTIPYGTQTNQAELPLAMNLLPSTLLAMLRDLVGSLERSGVRKCLILNSHGGNSFKGHLRELFGQTQVHLFLCDWFRMERAQYVKIFAQPDDHAGEMETSLILHIRPDLVALDRADPTPAKTARFEALRAGWVETPRPWHRLTFSTGVGDPRAATSDKGKQWAELLIRRLADFLIELAASELDDSFPFLP